LQNKDIFSLTSSEVVFRPADQNIRKYDLGKVCTLMLCRFSL